MDDYYHQLVVSRFESQSRKNRSVSSTIWMGKKGHSNWRSKRKKGRANWMMSDVKKIVRGMKTRRKSQEEEEVSA